jgi:2,5-dihydroxypyridine 5,6-dioxygenase
MNETHDAEADLDTLVGLFTAHLGLCKVRSGEKVAILTEGGQFAARVRAYKTAIRALGAEALHVDYKPTNAAVTPANRLENVGRSGLRADRKAMEALKQADLVIDMMLLLFSQEQLEIQNAGTRIVLVVEPTEILTRLFPSENLRRRVEAAERRLGAARALRVTNAAGTDVVYDVVNRPILTEYGYTDAPGRWDHWPGGFLATVANPGGVNGRVVLAVGDIVYPLKRQMSEPVTFDIVDGCVISVSGGTDAESISAYMQNYHDSRAYSVSHIGWGLNELCSWSVDLPGIGMDGRAYYGNVLFSTGPDTEFGGTNDTACHLDMPMRSCTLSLDGEIIVDAGRVLPADMRAPGR